MKMNKITAYQKSGKWTLYRNLTVILYSNSFLPKHVSPFQKTNLTNYNEKFETPGHKSFKTNKKTHK